MAFYLDEEEKEQEGGQAVLRTYVPTEQMRASWLSLTIETEQAFTGFALQGISLMFNNMGSRIK